MKQSITIGRNKNWKESVALGFLGGALSIILLPLTVIIFTLAIIMFIVGLCQELAYSTIDVAADLIRTIGNVALIEQIARAALAEKG